MKKKLNDVYFVLSQKFGYDISSKIVLFFYENRLKSSLYSHILTRYGYRLYKYNKIFFESSSHFQSKIVLYTPDCIPLEVLKILKKLKRYQLINNPITFHTHQWLWHYRFFHSRLFLFEESILENIYNILNSSYKNL